MSSTSPFLFASDIDGTLLGDEIGEAWLHQFVASQNSHFILAYITGRYCESVLALIEQGRLPRPRFICGNVGTEIIDLSDSSNSIGKAYAAQVPSTWDIEEIYRRGIGDGIRIQEFERGQPRFQAGFNWDARAESLQAFHERISTIDGIYTQTSYDMYIDVFPSILGKGNAVHFLRRQLNLQPRQVVIAGDSGNDRQMFETGYSGIVPVNAFDELKALAKQPWHYHSPYPAGRGVFDGLQYFGFTSTESAIQS